MKKWNRILQRAIAAGDTTVLIGASFGVFAQPVQAAPAAYAAPDWFSQKYGIFVHYVPGLTTDKNGVVISDINLLASQFDAQGFANDLASFGVQYVKFTAWHAGMYPLYPSAKMTAWRGAGTSASIDLIGQMIDAVRAKGIAVMLYTHPRDGHDMSPADQIATSWGTGAGTNPEPDPATFNFSMWNNFINDIYGELLDLYGSRISGIYLDEGSPTATSYNVIDFPRLRLLIKSKAPSIVIAQNNYGRVYTSDTPDREYFKWDSFASNDGSTWVSDKYQAVSTSVTSHWFTSVPSTTITTNWSASDIFRYIVLQSGTNVTGGGVAWAAGVYPGGGWENGFASTMSSVNALLTPVRSSIIDTYPSPSWPTVDHSTVGGLPWGVATRSTDNMTTYLHVLKAPSAATLSIPAPADGRTFSDARLLASGTKVTLSQTSSGVSVTLPSGTTWSATDTVIALSSPSLATGAMATASSSVNGGGWGIAEGIDGQNLSTVTSMGYSSLESATSTQAQSYTVDLGASKTIDTVAVMPRSDGANTGYGLPVDYSIDISTDGSNWVTKSSVVDRPLSAISITTNFGPATARYVRLTGTKLRANPNDAGLYRMQFAELTISNNGMTSASTTITNVASHRALQGTGAPFGPSTKDMQVIARPPFYMNSEYAWAIADAGFGYVTITNLARGLRLSATAVRYQNRTDVNQVSQSSVAANDSQLWIPVTAGNGYVRFVNKQYNMALHVTGDLWSTDRDSFNLVIVPAWWNSDDERFKIG